MSILVITTGGTIGAEACEDLKRPDKIRMMPPPGVDPVRDALDAELACFATRYVSFEHRDSNYIDYDYRDRLLRLIENAPETAILITHGTDTLLQSAEFVFNRQGIRPILKDKVMLFTGAMVPLRCGGESDGYVNLGFALQMLAEDQMNPGVYIVLCDYLRPDTKEGWAPRLYPFAPGQYEKYYDSQDARKCRLRAIGLS